MKNLNSNKFRNKWSLIIGLMLSQAICSISLSAQSITVVVEDQSVLTLDRLDVFVTLIEAKYNSTYSINSEKFVAKLDVMKLENKLFDSRVDSTFYKKNKTQDAIKTTKTSNFHIVVYNLEDRNNLTGFIKSRYNIKIDSTNIKSKNGDLKLNEMTDELLSQAKLKANEMAVKMNRKTTEISNVKVLQMGVGGTSSIPKNYKPLEEIAYVKLEVTFETEEL